MEMEIEIERSIAAPASNKSLSYFPDSITAGDTKRSHCLISSLINIFNDCMIDEGTTLFKPYESTYHSFKT